MRASSFSSSSNVPFVFPGFALFFLPNLLPHPRSQQRPDRCSSTRVQGESVLLLAFIRACRRGRHGGACHAYVILAMESPSLRYWTTKARSVATVGICYRVGGGSGVSPRWVQGWEGTHILSSFFDLTPGAGASRFGAALVVLLSPLACSLPIYI
jgi:hypothetical protein